MKINIGEGTKTLFKEILVSHPGEETLKFEAKLRYHCGDYSKDLFKEINEYLESLDDAVQAKLYKLYREALNIIEPTTFGIENARCRDDVINNMNYTYLINNTRPIVDEIFDLLKPKNLQYVIQQSGWAEAPPGLRETINRGEYSSDITVNVEEYKQVAEFTLLIRPLFPIFAQMITKLSKITGNDYKEVVTGGLINQNPLIINHPGWKRVKSYVSNFYSSKGTNPLQLSVISEDSYDHHATYIAVFTRLCCAHVPSIDKRKNLAKVLFSVVKQFDSGTNNVREKNFKGFDEMNEKRGLHEIYQLKEEVSSADIQMQSSFFTMQHYDNTDKPILKNRFVNQCRALGINNPDLVDKVYELIPANWEFYFSQPVQQLLQLAFVDDISYDIYMHLDYEELMSAMALAAVKLDQMGFPNLSQIVMCKDNPNGEYEDTDKLFALTEEDKADLLSLCHISKTKETVSTENELVSSVMDFLSHLGSGTWHSVIEPGMACDEGLIAACPSGHLFEIEMSREIKSELISLIKAVS